MIIMYKTVNICKQWWVGEYETAKRIASQQLRHRNKAALQYLFTVFASPASPALALPRRSFSKLREIWWRLYTCIEIRLLNTN